MRKIYLAFIILLFFYSCKNNDWRHVKIYSPNSKHVITIITKGNDRYIMSGDFDEIPNTGYALVDLSTVDPIGDEIGICWDNNGYDWELLSEYSTFIKSDLDSSKFFIQKKMNTNNKGIPNIKNYFHDGCVLIIIREKTKRSKEANKTKVVYVNQTWFY